MSITIDYVGRLLSFALPHHARDRLESRRVICHSTTGAPSPRVRAGPACPIATPHGIDAMHRLLVDGQRQTEGVPPAAVARRWRRSSGRGLARRVDDQLVAVTRSPHLHCPVLVRRGQARAVVGERGPDQLDAVASQLELGRVRERVQGDGLAAARVVATRLASSDMASRRPPSSRSSVAVSTS